MNRQVVCDICNKEWYPKSGKMVYESLNRHLKAEHRKEQE